MTESTDLTNNILCIEPGEKMQVKSTFLTDFFYVKLVLQLLKY